MNKYIYFLALIIWFISIVYKLYTAARKKQAELNKKIGKKAPAPPANPATTKKPTVIKKPRRVPDEDLSLEKLVDESAYSLEKTTGDMHSSAGQADEKRARQQQEDTSPAFGDPGINVQAELRTAIIYAEILGPPKSLSGYKS
jgi:hypothetical protein